MILKYHLKYHRFKEHHFEQFILDGFFPNIRKNIFNTIYDIYIYDMYISYMYNFLMSTKSSK